MKLRVLSRSDAEWGGRHDGARARARFSANRSARLHAPQRALDVQRAVTAAKLDRLLARPFLFACAPSHADGVYAVARSRADVALLASVAADGELRLWHLPSRSARLAVAPPPRAFARAVSFSHDSAHVLFATDAARVYSLPVPPPDAYPAPADAAAAADAADAAVRAAGAPPRELHHYRVPGGAAASLHASFHQPLFATAAAAAVHVWHQERSAPLQTLALSADSLHCVRWNPAEPSVLASAGADRAITLYDVRARAPIRRLVLAMRTNDLSWNPVEPMNFVAANDDHNCYSYDMRRLSARGATAVHVGHTAAVMAVDFAPTGRQFVSGSYDKTLRIFDHTAGRSRELYHTRRMQRVFAAVFSLDAAYVVSGSDDADVRVWKSERSRPLKPLFAAERQRLHAARKLVHRYQAIPHVRRIAKQRHAPAHVRAVTAVKAAIDKSAARKLRNRRAHTKPHLRPNKTQLRNRNIVRELE